MISYMIVKSIVKTILCLEILKKQLKLKLSFKLFGHIPYKRYLYYDEKKFFMIF